MRRRILLSMVAMLAGICLLLGLPLMFTAWWWVDDQARSDLDGRLRNVAAKLIDQEVRAQQRPVLDIAPFRLLIPAGGQLTLTYPGSDGVLATTSVGASVRGPRVSESADLGGAGAVKMSIPQGQVRSDQWTAVGVVALIMTVSMAAGTSVAAFTATRLADPIEDLADRATSMAEGDFRTAWKTHGITEIDRVIGALQIANREIALRLEREGEIVGEVSHQLRSRLTAIQLRLDELTLHDDPAVVAEAEAAHEQSERLNREIDELIAISRDSAVIPTSPISVRDTIDPLITDFAASYTQANRSLTARYHGSCSAWATPSRLREATSVLIDNALRHGSGAAHVDVAELEGSPMLRVSVSDEGAGVSDDRVSLIFRRGFSAGGSSGVGLSLARALVESDGGRLDLTQRRPTTFTIVLLSEQGGPLTSPPERSDRVTREPR